MGLRGGSAAAAAHRQDGRVTAARRGWGMGGKGGVSYVPYLAPFAPYSLDLSARTVWLPSYCLAPSVQLSLFRTIFLDNITFIIFFSLSPSRFVRPYQTHPLRQSLSGPACRSCLAIDKCLAIHPPATSTIRHSFLTVSHSS